MMGRMSSRRRSVMTRKTLAVLTFSFFVLFTSAGSAAAEEIRKDFHKSFDVTEGASLSLRFGDGDVKLIPWEKNVIDVNVRYRADIAQAGIRLGKDRDFDVEFRQTANTVYVIGKERSGATIGFFNERVYEYVYEIHSPNYVALDLDGDDGSVEVGNWAARIDCRVDDGDIHLTGIAGGKTQIWGEDGDVEIARLSGDLTVEVDDGEVNLVDCDMKNCRVASEDGNITISQSKGFYDLSADDGDIVAKKIEARGLAVRTEDGDVDIDLLTAETLDADIKTDDGDINIDLDKTISISFYVSADDADSIRIEIDDVENLKQDEHSKSGSINGGAGRLRIQTADGNVLIRERL
jgi:hypothetical protein